MRGTSVLIVDDEEGLRHGLENLFTREGFTVHTAASYESAVSAAARYPVDAAVVDVRLKGERSGIDLLRELKRLEPDLVVLVITGYGTIPTAVEATRLGVVDYIEKPFTPEQIVDATKRALVGEKKACGYSIEAEDIKEVLVRAAREPDFCRSLMEGASHVLSGYALSADAKAAIVSGDIAWIEKECGTLSAEERDWLERRLQAEVW